VRSQVKKAKHKKNQKLKNFWGCFFIPQHFFFFSKHFLSKERTCAKKECNSFGKAFLSKKRFVLKEKLYSFVDK
jgi:hypothetical protein